MSEPENPFGIDPGRLDREIVNQPRASRAAGVAEADARHAHAQAKARLDVTDARLRLAIKAAPEKFGLTKPTVDDLAAAVELHPDHQAARTALDEAKYALDVASANTNAMLDRRKMIERLVELLALDYHAEKEPFVPVGSARDRAEARLRDSARRPDPE